MHHFQFMDAKKPASFKANSPEVMASLGIIANFTMDHAELLRNHDPYQGGGKLSFDLNWKCACVHGDYQKLLMSQAFMTPSGPHFLHKDHIFPEIAGTQTQRVHLLHLDLKCWERIPIWSNMNPSGTPPWSKNANNKIIKSNSWSKYIQILHPLC